jgi:hypothetical protein
MAEANRSISQSLTIRITTAAHVLSMLRARNAVKDELRAGSQGFTLRCEGDHCIGQPISS